MFIASVDCFYNEWAITTLDKSNRYYFIRKAKRKLTFIEHTLTGR